MARHTIQHKKNAVSVWNCVDKRVDPLVLLGMATTPRMKWRKAEEADEVLLLIDSVGWCRAILFRDGGDTRLLSPLDCVQLGEIPVRQSNGLKSRLKVEAIRDVLKAGYK